MTTKEIPLQLHMLRSWKGAPVSVVMALWFSGMPQNVKWLQRQTGYRFEAVQEALEVLLEYQMVTRIDRYHWQIAGNTRQFPLGQAMLGTGEDEDEGLITTETILPLFESPNHGDFGKTEVPVSELPENSGTSEKPKSDFGKTEVPVSSSSRSINLDSKNKELLLARDELVEIFDEFGVREPKRSQLINAGIEPRSARFHLETAPNVAMAIFRMQAGWPVKKGWQPRAVFGDGDESPLDPPFCPSGKGGEMPEIPDNQIEAFGRALECLRANIPHSVFQTWFSSLRMTGPVEDGEVTIRAANSFVVDHVKPYAGDLARLLGSEFGTTIEVKFIVM
ncbi:hypothetical protein hrd7_25160 [Leptolinea sp. HRD-7]|nr:hypothetical protein hrd7_25160 [Leptolinea sp. HRD-7]